jgi:hypothetical protein
MHHFSFARPIALLPASLEAKLATQATLSDDEDELLNAIRGVAPGFPRSLPPSRQGTLLWAPTARM